jgi:hypothetical protein
MATQIFKCECGQDFEDSEFRISPECDECRISYMTSRLEPLTSLPSYQPWENAEANAAPTERLQQSQGLQNAAQQYAAQPYDASNAYYRQNLDGTFTLAFGITQGQ